MKVAIVVMPGSEANNDEALGRVFNALGVAYDFKNHGDEVALVFLGAGPRWAAQIAKGDHPLNVLYQSMGYKVAGSRQHARISSVPLAAPSRQASPC